MIGYMNKPMKFKNRENEEINLPDGRTIWLSRSPSTVATILSLYKNDIYVLIEKRSETMMDHRGKWCLICGYLDWDENGYDGVIRETYEESGLYLPDYKFKNNDYEQPFYVNTELTENLQNIALHYCFILDTKILPNVESYENPEIAKLKWVSIKDTKKYNLIFQHDERIKMAVEKYTNLGLLK